MNRAGVFFGIVGLIVMAAIVGSLLLFVGIVLYLFLRAF